MEVGDFVRGERKRQGLTQQQLANKSGVGLNFVYQLEKNKPSVQLDSLNQVLRALGYCVSVKRDFRPWDAPELPRTSAAVPDSSAEMATEAFDAEDEEARVAADAKAEPKRAAASRNDRPRERAWDTI